MAILSNESESLTSRDIKFLASSFVIIAAATVVGLYLYNDVLKIYWTKQQNSQLYSQTKIFSQPIKNPLIESMNITYY